MAISALFAAAEKGAWYDASDLSTMWQDTAGTVPVTGAGQSVALWRDKSGNANHASMSTTSQRPTLQQDANGRFYLQFDGVDDFLTTTIAGIGGNTDKSIFAAAQFSSVTNSTIFHLGVGSTGASFGFGFGGVAAALNLFQWAVDISAGGHSTGVQYVLSGIKTGSALEIRRNGASVSGPTTVAAANVTSTSATIGRQTGGSAPLSGRLYGLVVRGAATSGAELTTAEADMAALMAASGANGTASGVLPLSGAASGTAAVQGQGAGSLPLSGSASGAAAVSGAASGSLPLSGAATGAVAVRGQASGSLPLSGAASGSATGGVQGAGSGSLPLSGSAAGVVAVQGQAAGSLPLAGASQGAAPSQGQATGSLPLSGAAQGAVAVRGQAAGALPLSGAAAGVGPVTTQPTVTIPGQYRSITIAGAYAVPTIPGAYGLVTIPGRWRVSA